MEPLGDAVRAEILAKAEQQAAEIFSRAGINVLWIACPVSPT